MATDAGKYVLALSELAEEAQWGTNERSQLADELMRMQCHDSIIQVYFINMGCDSTIIILQCGPNFGWLYHWKTPVCPKYFLISSGSMARRILSTTCNNISA